jgi:hypothetical protein
MKRVHRLFVLMIAAVLSSGTSLAAQASPAPQQANLQNSEKSAERQKDDVRNDNEKEQARPKQADEDQEQSGDVMRTTTKHRPSASHAKQVPIPRAHPAKTQTKNSPRTDAGKVAPLEQMGSTAAASIRSEAVGHHSPTVPSSAVSVDGQQFKNSRDPGARLAVSGGPPASARGTAAINGTTMKRKP